MKKREVVVELRETGGKAFEEDFSRFFVLHGASRASAWKGR